MEQIMRIARSLDEPLHKIEIFRPTKPFGFRHQTRRWERVWRCSQQGVVASTLVEKPQVNGFLPLVDSGFDLRYTALWETREGAGRMLFCQLDVTDRIGLDPVADALLTNLIADLKAPVAAPRRTARLAVACTDAPLAALESAAGPALADGNGQVLVIPRGSADWITRCGSSLPAYLASGGRVVAAGLTTEEGQALAHCVGDAFAVASETLWLNPLTGPLPAAFAGVSPAGIHWRKKLAVATVAKVPAEGWRAATGVLARIPIGQGEIIWLSPLPGDFDPEQRPDLVFSQVNTERLYTLVLANLGVPVGNGWSSRLGPAATPPEAGVYTDQRIPRDDPYANMRW